MNRNQLFNNYLKNIIYDILERIITILLICESLYQSFKSE